MILDDRLWIEKHCIVILNVKEDCRSTLKGISKNEAVNILNKSVLENKNVL